VALTLTAWLLGSSSIELIVGPLSDQHGRRPVLFVGGLIFLAASFACALAPSLEILIIARFFQGLGVCALMVSGYAAVHEWYPDAKAVPILAWLGSAAIVAPMIGPTIGAEILQWGDWRVIFWVILVLAAVGLGGLYLVMPESLILRDHKALHPHRFLRVYWRILKNGRFMLSSLVFGCGYAGLLVWIGVSSFILIELFGVDPRKYGFLQIPIFGAYFIGAKGIKYILPHLMRRYEIWWGVSLVFLAGIAMIFFSIIYPDSSFSILIPIACYAFGFGMASAPLSRRTLTSTHESRGSAIAMFYFVMMILGALGTLSITFFYRANLVSAALIIATLAFLALVGEFIRATRVKPTI